MKVLFLLGILAIFCSQPLPAAATQIGDTANLTPQSQKQPMKKLKVLMIGNSFAICVGKNLPKIVKASGNGLVLGCAHIGGCTLETHWKHLQEADANPDHRPYHFRLWRAEQNGSAEVEMQQRMGNVNEMLKMEPWDVVTIQQGSHASWNYETYQPYAQNIIARIRRDAPQARIVIQQTWAYCASDGRLQGSPFPQKNNVHWDFDQNGMYERLTAAYCRLARENSLEIIPTGYAVQLFRKNVPQRAPELKPQEIFSLSYPDTLSQEGEPVGNLYWFLDSNTGRKEIAFDTIHLNPLGEYLQGCVWFLSLFGANAADIHYLAPGMSPETARFCQETAERAVRDFRQ